MSGSGTCSPAPARRLSLLLPGPHGVVRAQHHPFFDLRGDPRVDFCETGFTL